MPVIPSRFGIIYTPNPCSPVRVTPSASVYFRVRENSAIPTIIKIRPGMMIFENFSIPFSTPRYTINAVAARNASIKKMGEALEVIKAVKYPSRAASAPRAVR